MSTFVFLNCSLQQSTFTISCNLACISYAQVIDLVLLERSHKSALVFLQSQLCDELNQSLNVDKFDDVNLLAEH